MFLIRRNIKYLTALMFAAVIMLVFQLGLLISSDQISFSHPSGFYDESFELEIHCGLLYEIYYTLDGSEPTTESMRYQRGAALKITDATPNQNRYVTRTEISFGYSRQQLEEIGLSHWNYAAPTQNVDKCTVIRAAAFYNGARVSDSICGVYFVGWQNREAYQDVYMVSLTVEPEDLFGYKDGIMVTGQALDDHLEQMKATQEIQRKWWWWQGNYRNSGYEWERIANITVFNRNRELEMDQKCGIRMHGAVSRAFPLKSIRCFARPEYAGLDFFETDWFGDKVQPSKFILYAGGNDAGGGNVCVNIKDYMMGHFGRECNFATMKFIPCALFINGEFWGFYHIAEHYNSKYIADHYAVNENNVVMIKNNEVAEGSLSDYQLYEDMKQTISDLDMSSEESYRIACDLIDIDSYVDYYAFMIYIARSGDWPNDNYALWRTLEKENSIYGDGKWRWMMFDVNSAGLAKDSKIYAKEDTLQKTLKADPMFASLFRNKEFQKKFAERIMYIGNTILYHEKCNSFIDTFFEDYNGLMQYSNIHTYNDPKEEMLVVFQDNLKQFFLERCGVVYAQLENYLDSEVVSSLKKEKGYATE